MLRRGSRPTYSLCILLLALTGCSRCGSSPEKKVEPTKVAATVPAPKTDTPTPEIVSTPTIESTPTVPEPTPAPTVDPQVIAACKQAVANLDSGNLKGVVEAFPPAKRQQLAADPALASAAGCLAIASDNTHYCDLLSKQGQSDCAARRDLLRDLKTTPNKQMKALVVYRGCLLGGQKAECDKLRVAMASHKAADCKSMVKPSDRDFCAALASGDTSTCTSLPDPYRDLCNAYTSEDPSRCSEQAGIDCPKLAGGFAEFEKRGIAAFEKIDPEAVAARRDGKKACAPLLAALEARCVAQ